MTSLKKKLRLRRLRREAESQRLMTEIAGWITAASRFDQPTDRPDTKSVEPDEPALKSDVVKRT